MPEELTPNFNTRNSSNAYEHLDKALKHSPDGVKLAEDDANGTLDDGVDITDPHYDESETEKIEQELAIKDGISPPEYPESPTEDPPTHPETLAENPPKTNHAPANPLLQSEQMSYSIENPSNPNPF